MAKSSWTCKSGRVQALYAGTAPGSMTNHDARCERRELVDPFAQRLVLRVDSSGEPIRKVFQCLHLTAAGACGPCNVVGL